MASREVWGIDIGKSSIKAVKMRLLKKQVEISDIEIIVFDEGGSDTENVDRDEQVRQGLSEFLARKKLKREKVFVSIPGQATFNRMITLPVVDAKRLPEIVRYEAQQQIPFPIEEVIWDYQPIDQGNMASGELEVMLFAVKKEIVNNFLENLSAAQLDVDGIQIAPLALYNFIKYDQPELEASVVIDIGAENTDLVVVDGNKLWIRALPSAGNDVTKALQQRFNIPMDEAEKLKIKAGKSKQSKKIFEVMKPVLKDLVGEIHRSVGYYKSMANEVKFDKMILMGNATKLVGFKKFFSQNLQYKVDILSSLRRIRLSSKVEINLFQANVATFPVAIGLALQGLGLATNNIRLLPKELQIEKEIQSKKPIFITAVVLLGLALALWYYFAISLNDRLKDVQRKVDPTIAKVKRIKNAKRQALQYGKIKNKIQQLIGIGHGREKWLYLFRKVNEVLQDANKRILQASDTAERSGKIWLISYKSGKVEGGKSLKAVVEVGYARRDTREDDVLHVKEYVIRPLQNLQENGKYVFKEVRRSNASYESQLAASNKGDGPKFSTEKEDAPYFIITIEIIMPTNASEQKSE